MSEITDPKLDGEVQEDLVDHSLQGNPGPGPDDLEDDDDGKPTTRERRKIEIRFIQDKSRRHITFSKRKAGIMKKAYELSVLTGTQVLLLVVSETGLVYTFTTPKLQPLVTKPEGKNLIQACLNAPEEAADEEEASTPTGAQQQASQQQATPQQQVQQAQQSGSRPPAGSGGYPQQPGIQNIPQNSGYLNPEQTAVYQTYFGGINQQGQF
jgi:hypothetical protein